MAVFVVLGAVRCTLCLREDDQANPAFVKKSGRRALHPGLGAIWLFPQSDQALRLHHCHRSMLPHPRSGRYRRAANNIARQPGALVRVQTPTTTFGCCPSQAHR